MGRRAQVRRDAGKRGVAKRGSRATSWAIGVLAVLTGALALSAAFARFRPQSALRMSDQPEHAIRVQVLNGSGEGGIGLRVASHLREGGFQVVEVKNADRIDYFATLVVARDEDVTPAHAVARYLGKPPVIHQEWTSGVAQVTVVLGRDRSRLRLN
jgi:hypothetical protein